jgi:signal transduction histidine kinase
MTEIIIEKFYLFFQGILLFQALFFGTIYAINKRKDTLIYCLMIFVTLLYFFLNATELFFNIEENYVYNLPFYIYLNFAIFLLMMLLYATFLFEIFRDGPGCKVVSGIYRITKNSIFVIYFFFVLFNILGISSQFIFYISHFINGPFICYIIFYNFNEKGFKSLIIKGMILIFTCLLITIYFTIQYNSSNHYEVNIFDKYPLLFIRIGMLADIFLFQLALLKRWNEQEKALITKDFESKLALEKMRNNISVQLHDDVGANLSSLNFLVEILRKKSDQGELILDKIVNNINETSTLLSDTIWAINPLYDSLSKVLERVMDFGNNLLLSKDITFQASINDNVYGLNLNADQRRNLYFTLKEGINNIAKHSQATKVDLEIESKNGKLTINLNDNGVGFDSEKEFKGNGLNNLKKRDGLKIKIESNIGEGTSIRIEL